MQITPSERSFPFPTGSQPARIGPIGMTENPTPMSCSTQQSVIALRLRSTRDPNSGNRGQAEKEKKGKSRQTSARPERKPNTKLRRRAHRFPPCFLSDVASSVSWRAESDSIEALYGHISASLTLPRLLVKKCNDEIVCSVFSRIGLSTARPRRRSLAPIPFVM